MLLGEPPPASPTFSAAPGGVALLSRLPFSLRRLHPAPLHKWNSMGRILVGEAYIGSISVVLVGIYAFAPSHPDFATNDELCVDVCAWAGAQKCCLMVAGDFNAGPTTCGALASCREFGLHRISPEKPTTCGRAHDLAKHHAIDHVLVNEQLLQFSVSCDVDYGVTISDHYPLLSAFSLPGAAWPSWVSPPSPPRSFPPRVASPPFPSFVSSFQEWSELARKWIRRAHGVSVPPKHLVTTSCDLPKPTLPPRKCTFLLKTMRAYQHVSKLQAPQPEQVAALERKLMKVSCITQGQVWSEHDVFAALKAKLMRALHKAKEDALKEWKARVRKWTMGSPALYSYIRNQPPPRVLALSSESGPTNDPHHLAMLLNQYWASVESWPEDSDCETVWLRVEDTCIPFLPNVPCSCAPTGLLLHDTAKRMKHGAAGVDAWTTREIKLLPPQAWDALAKLLRRWFLNPFGPPLSTAVLRKRRTPIEKKQDDDGLPDVHAIRPIDVHSVLIRVYSSCLANMVRPWLREVTHPTQAACHQGILAALAKIALWSELALNTVGDIFAISLDLTKMYNTVSPTIAKRMAIAAGMCESTANMLAGPLEWADAVWRLPRNAPNTPTKNERGLSQGLSASIVFSELVMAALVRKLHLALPCDTIGYIDDLHVITNSIQSLVAAYRIIHAYTQTLCLQLSAAKSGLWSTRPQQLVELSQESGIPIVTTITALGGQWQVSKGPKPSFTSDSARVKVTEERLMRVSHLPSHPTMRAKAVGVACLPKIDYLPAPSPPLYKPLRAKVRKAIGQTTGAPEVVYNIPTNAVLDPPDRVFLGLLRLWYYCSRLSHFNEFLALRNPSRSKGRLGHFLVLCKKHHCIVDAESITFQAEPGDLTLRFAQGWTSLRKNAQAHMKNIAFLNLQKRRPLSYGAPYQCDWKVHKRYFASLSAYHASTIMRIWSGVAMTKAHAFSLKLEESPECSCGLGPEDVRHILWTCPYRQRNRPMDLTWWERLPPASSMCLICPYGQSQEFVRAWKRVCAWALAAISGRTRENALIHDTPLPSAFELPIAYRDINDHCVAIMRDTDYAFCVKCYVARRKKDLHFLTSRRCMKREEIPLPVGHYARRDGHLVQLVVAPWKQASLRPRLECKVCGKSQWATAAFRELCSPP